MASRTQLSGNWTTKLDLQTARQKLQTFFTQNQMKVTSEQPGDPLMIYLEQGSQVTTRMIGALFVDPAQLPKQANLGLRTTENGLIIEAMIGETLGFGLLDPGSQGRYEDYFRRWMSALMAALPPVEGTQSTNLTGDPSAAPTSQPQPAANAPTGSGGAAFTVYRAAKSRGTAYLLEILLGLMGLPGIGWIYAGNGKVGLILMISWIVLDCIGFVIIIASAGIALLCTIPINIAMVIISNVFLNKYMNANPGLFSA